MAKLIIDHSPTNQILIEVERTGGFSDRTKVLWDERVDGEIEPGLLASVGGLIRVGNLLQVDAQKLADFQAVKQSEQDARDQTSARVAAAKTNLDAFSRNATPTQAQDSTAIKALITIVRDLQKQF